MPCYHPARHPHASDGFGSRRIDFQRTLEQALPREPGIGVSCGRCLGCRRAVQRDWTIRCFHESLLHTEKWTAPDGVTTEIPSSCMVTLTYDDEHLPAHGALRKRDVRNFLKRYRNHVVRKRGEDRGKRFFGCGEYGGRKKRPHFHILLFGEQFDDFYEMQDPYSGKRTRHSYTLDELWCQAAYKGGPRTNIGRATVDPLTYQSAAYVAGYVAKKDGPEMGPWHLTYDDRMNRMWPTLPPQKWLRPIQAEYRFMSSHPGLAHDWIDNPRNVADVYENGVRIGDLTFPPPRYYFQFLEKHRPDLVEAIKSERMQNVYKATLEWDAKRCFDAEKVALASPHLRADSLD